MKQAERIFELPCYDSRKSFYRKAWVKECSNGEKLLQSYETIVCKIDTNNNVIRLWPGYSATTQRHINSFLMYYGMGEKAGKKEWDKMPIECGSLDRVAYRQCINVYNGFH